MRRLTIAIIAVLAFRPHAQAENPVELTAVGKAILEAKLASDGRPLQERPGPGKPLTFPLAMCTFPGGLCGAVRRDGSVAVPPRYDWVGTFFDGRAAIRTNGLYGFVDERGNEIVPPRYRIVGDYKFGYAQVDIDFRSGLIDRDGKMVVEPRYGFIEAMASDRFRVSETRQIAGESGAEVFSDLRVEFRMQEPGQITRAPEITKYGIMDRAGQWIEPAGIYIFDPDDRSIRFAQRDNRWGLERGGFLTTNKTWLVKPQFDAVETLSDSLARVRENNKIGFIDRSGRYVIDPVFDEAAAFAPGSASTPVRQGRSVGVIDRTGAWVFRIDADELRRAISPDKDGGAAFGWHFKHDDQWGLLDLDGHVLVDAKFDQPIRRCTDGHLVAIKDRVQLYLRNDGSRLLPPNTRILGAGCDSLAPFIVKVGDKFGLMDGEGKEIAPFAFDALIPVTRDIWNARRDGKWGRIGPDGRWLFEPTFDDLSRSNPIIIAEKNKRRGFLRADGRWLIEPRFEAVRPLDSETALVTMEGTTGVIRIKDQSWAITPRPGAMCEIPDGILSQREGHRTILSRSGEPWIDTDVDRLGIDLETGLLPFLKDGKWGLMDTAGNIAIAPIYGQPVNFKPSYRGIGWSKRGDRLCPIGRHGQAVPGIVCIEPNRSSEAGDYFKCAVGP